MGYGPATYSTVEQTKEVREALNKIEVDEFKSRYDGQKMNEQGLYPGSWDQPEILEYLVVNFNSLKDFYHKASEENQAVIIFIN